MIRKKIIFLLVLSSLLFILFCNIDDYEETKNNEIILSDYVQNNYNEIPSSVTSEINIIIYNDSGEEVATINGDSAEFIEDDAIIQNMQVLFQSEGENGKEFSNLLSDYGKINLGKKIEAWGNVIMIKEDEYRLETEKIVWEKNERSNKSTEESTDGTLRTADGKLVTIYYADGTVIKGKNGYWEQGGNKITLEETYTHSDRTTAGNDDFLSTGTNTATSGTSSEKTDEKVSSSNNSNTDKTTNSSITSTTNSKNTEEKEMVSNPVSNTRRKTESSNIETNNPPVEEEPPREETKDTRTSLELNTSGPFDMVNNLKTEAEEQINPDTSENVNSKKEIEELILMVKESDKFDDVEKHRILKKLENNEMTDEEISLIRKRLSE
jgi:hypothetical protein